MRKPAFLLVAVVAACHPRPTTQDTGVDAGNAVQREMRALDEAMRDSVTAVAWDDYAAIPRSLHRVHEARATTEHALESGEYVLRRNAERREEFESLDHALHADLEKLEDAANAKDPKATPAQLGVVLGQCHGCHAVFR